MTEKFSVIIPLLNRGPYIRRAVESVLNQTIQHFEIIIIDGGSEDNGPEIIKSYHDPRIHFSEQSGKGVSNARNEAVHFSKNEYIAFLDADDEWMPRHLETILRMIKKYPDAGMFSTAFKISSAGKEPRWANFQAIPKPPWEGLLPDFFRSGAMGDDPVLTSVVVIPRQIFYEMGGFCEGYWYGEDTDLFGKIALKYPVAFSWEFGALYHVDAQNRSCEKKMPFYHEEPFVTTARMALMNGKVPPGLKESLHEFIAKKEIYRCYWVLHEGNLKDAQVILKQCTTKLRKQEKMKLLILAGLPPRVYMGLRDMRQKLSKMIQKK
jgi:glycosyltransferase involved in cell wall biosynthesis